MMLNPQSRFPFGVHMRLNTQIVLKRHLTQWVPLILNLYCTAWNNYFSNTVITSTLLDILSGNCDTGGAGAFSLLTFDSDSKQLNPMIPTSGLSLRHNLMLDDLVKKELLHICVRFEISTETSLKEL